MRDGEVHDRAHVVGRNHDGRLQVRLFNMVDMRRVRHILGGMKAHHVAVGFVHVVFHARGGSNQVEPEFALETLLDNLHVKQPQESHAEPEAERMAILRLPDKRGVVEGEFLQRLLQRLVLVSVDREQARIDHGLGLAIARKRLFDASDLGGDRVAHADLRYVFQASDQISYFADRKLRKRNLRRDGARPPLRPASRFSR